MPNLYASLYQMKIHMAMSNTVAEAILEGTVDDARLLRILEAVSREIDVYCGRRFFVESRARYFDGRRTTDDGRRGYYGIRVDDLLSVTTLKTDEDGDRVYEVTWATTDYDLEPVNALYESPPGPYTRICPAPLGDYSFPSGARAIEIVGSWGFSQELRSAVTTVGGAGMTDSATSFTATSGAALSPGETILVDSEQMYVSGISSNTVTVQRSVNGTTAAAHLTSAAIAVYRYPSVVTEACLYQSALNNLAGAAATGQAGSGEFQQPIRAGGLHPFAKQMLDPLRRLEIA